MATRPGLPHEEQRVGAEQRQCQGQKIINVRVSYRVHRRPQLSYAGNARVSAP